MASGFLDLVSQFGAWLKRAAICDRRGEFAAAGGFVPAVSQILIVQGEADRVGRLRFQGNRGSSIRES